MEDREGEVDDYLRWVRGSSKIMPRHTGPIATKRRVGWGGGGDFVGASRGGGEGGEATVLKICLLLYGPHLV